MSFPVRGRYQDGTLWWPEMYMLSGAPFKKDANGAVYDRCGCQLGGRRVVTCTAAIVGGIP
eukprot:156133-Pelagomonas_calceolata.AAC.2